MSVEILVALDCRSAAPDMMGAIALEIASKFCQYDSL
jgi:hypothetical protein